MEKMRSESDSLGAVDVPADKLWGAQTQRSLEHFSIGVELMPREMIGAYAFLKKGAAIVNARDGRLPDRHCQLIVAVCDELLAGRHQDMFPLGVWMSGSGTQFNMNVNEVIANRCSQLAGQPLGGKAPVHPNDHVNMAQSSNDSFPSAMSIAAATGVSNSLLPAVTALRDAIAAKADEWKDIVKIGRTHMQDATPLTLGQEWSGYAGMLSDDLDNIEAALKGVYRLALGGTAVGTGLNSPPGFAEAAAAEIAALTGLPFVTAPNKFTVQGAHNALVSLSGALKTLAVSLFKIANDIRLMSCGPRAGFAELLIPENEPGSSIMPGKVNPTQCEAITMVAVQVMANDVAINFGGASGYLEMNVYKPLMIYNLMQSIRLLTDSVVNFNRFLVAGARPNLQRIKAYVDQSLMLVTALAPVIGYDEASKIAHYASDHDLTLRDAALQLGIVSEADFDRIVDPAKMVNPYVAEKCRRRSAPGQFFQRFGIAVAEHLDGLGGGFDVAQVVGRQLDRGRADILLQAMQLGRARNGNDPGLLRQQPGERDLGRRRLFSRGDRGEKIDQRLIGLERLGREARQRAAEIVAAETGLPGDRAGEEPLAERAVGHEADPEFLERRQHAFLGPAPPQRIFALQRRHRLDRMGAADGFFAGFGQSEMLDLALGDQVPDRAGDVLDRHVGIDAVLIEQVDGLDPQPLQRGFGDPPDLLGPAVQARPRLRPGRIEVEPEFGRDHDLAAEGLQRLADEVFIGERAIDLGGVEEGDALFDRRAHQRDHLLPVVRRPVGKAHAHAAKADGGDFEAVGSKFAFLHRFESLKSGGVRPGIGRR